MTVANIESRDVLPRLVEEQAALRRVATLVAKGTAPDQVFAAVAQEVARVLGVPGVTLDRFEPEGATVVLAGWHAKGQLPWPIGSRWPLDGPSVAATIWATGRSAKIEDYSELPGAIASYYSDRPKARVIGVPIIVDGEVWGMIGVGSTQGEDVPADTEERLAGFTELVATAISNAATHSELIASRARIVAAGDEARRRIERNLHDGTQQRLIALGLDLAAVRAMVPAEIRDAHVGLERIEADIDSVLEEIREISRGLHPGLLARGGLSPSLRSLARRCPIAVRLDVEIDRRPPESVEIGVYYVVSEALTNAARHSHASQVSVTVRSAGTVFRATIEDDGVGGAQASNGSGLIGLIDRVEALGGRFALESPPGHGTRISIGVSLAAGTDP